MTKYHGTPYHLWNPFTDMDQHERLLDFGPVVIVRGEGPYVFNERGDRYINGISSLWNVAVGHGREELVEAAAGQMRELSFASCFRQAHPRSIELAARLVEITGGKYQRVFFSSNGSDAVEAALMMARQYHRQSRVRAGSQAADRAGSDPRGRFKVISLRGSYHGVSYGAKSACAHERDEAKYGPLVPGFLQIEPPYCYRCPFGEISCPGCGLRCAELLEEAILAEGASTVAAFILEPVMGDGGTIDPPDAYYAQVGEICRRHGVLFIADEVTTGFGRTGRLFTSENWEPQPDIMCVSKGITSGYLPMAATLVTDKVFQRFRGRGNRFNFGPTASGHPVCAAVALRNIDIIESEKLVENAAAVGEYLMAGLKELARTREVIGEVRGRGLMIGIELVKSRETKEPLGETEMLLIVADAAVHGLIVGYARNILGLYPPLIIDRAVADEILKILEKTLRTGAAAEVARLARLAKEVAVDKLR